MADREGPAFTVDEVMFLRNTIKQKLADLNLERQRQEARAEQDGDLILTLLLEENLHVGEEAWEKLKGVIL